MGGCLPDEADIFHVPCGDEEGDVVVESCQDVSDESGDESEGEDNEESVEESGDGCPEFLISKKNLKAKGKISGAGGKLRGKDADDVLCQCSEDCRSHQAPFWRCSLSKTGTSGKCTCYEGKLKKVKDLKGNKNGAIGATSAASLEALTKKAQHLKNKVKKTRRKKNRRRK